MEDMQDGCNARQQRLARRRCVMRRDAHRAGVRRAAGGVCVAAEGDRYQRQGDNNQGAKTLKHMVPQTAHCMSGIRCGRMVVKVGAPIRRGCRTDLPILHIPRRGEYKAQSEWYMSWWELGVLWIDVGSAPSHRRSW